MVDSLGYRMKFAVVAPSTNTSVEPEYAAMRPRGVTNHFSRIAIPDTRVSDDDSFMVMLANTGLFDFSTFCIKRSRTRCVAAMRLELFPWAKRDACFGFLRSCKNDGAIFPETF